MGTVLRRLLLTAVTGVAVLAMASSALGQQPKHGVRPAAACTDHWTNAAGGSFANGANWSAGVPTSSTDACIDAAGTYTVTVTTSTTVNSLSVGGSGITATLSVGSTCSEHVTLTTSAGLTNKSGSTLLLTNADNCGNQAAVAGPVSNAGTLTTVAAIGGLRFLSGNVTNTGTVNINEPTQANVAASVFTNQGTLNVANGEQLLFQSGASFTNGSGGSLVGTGTGNVYVHSGTLTEGAGTTSGSAPLFLQDGTLAYTGTGGSLIWAFGNNALSGNLASGQTLDIGSTCNEHAVTTAAASFTNAGTINLTNFDNCGNQATLALSSGTLTSSGTINSVAPVGGLRFLSGNVTNTGTVNINEPTQANVAASVFTNQGTLNVANGEQLLFQSGASFTNGSGGSLVGTGNGNVYVHSGTLTEGAGTTSGSAPLFLQDGTLAYTGTGGSLIWAFGNNALSGNLASGQTLDIGSTCNEHAVTTASASFTNAGTINLTNFDNCGNQATLALSSGTLTNGGTINSVAPVGGQRFLSGNVTNTGTVNVNQPTQANVAASVFTNQGTLNVANGEQLLFQSGASFTNGSGGSLVGAGTGNVYVRNGTLTEGAGTTSGTAPLFLQDGTLAYSGTGKSTISAFGVDSLSGNLASGQTLNIASTCNEHAVTTAAASFANAGTINLTNGDGCGNNATLTITGGGTLTNSGTVAALRPVGGARTVGGSVTSTKAVVVEQLTLTVTGNYTQSGKKASLTTASKSATGFGLLSVGGSAALDGTLALLHAKSFNPNSGTFQVVGAASVTGAFTKVSGAAIKIKHQTGFYFDPTYSATSASLVVTQATFTVPASAARGATVNVAGTAWPKNQSVTLTFLDASKGNKVTKKVTADGSGAFSTTITIPAGAVVGNGSITAKSDLTGVSVKQTINVT